jgi:hypothetical protein
MERVMQILGTTLRIYSNPNTRDDWDEYLDSIAFAHRILEIDAIGYSPFFMVFGREPTLPTDILYGKGQECEVDEKAYPLKHTRILRETHALAQKFRKNRKENEAVLRPYT